MASNPETGRIELSKLVLRLAPGSIVERTVQREQPVYVIYNPMRDEYLACNKALGLTLKFLNGRDSLEKVYRTIFPDPTKDQPSLASISPMIRQLLDYGVLISKTGLLQNNEGQHCEPNIPESRLLYFRRELIDILQRAPGLVKLLSHLYTPSAALSVFGLVIFAIYRLLANLDHFSDPSEILASISGWRLALIYFVFVIGKIVHELGHAAALFNFTTREGHSPNSIRMGISVFAGIPFPFTNTTSAWLLRDKWHRIAIGLGGMYFELILASFATIGWSFVASGLIQAILLQIILVFGISTLVFNLNPLIRLDGYYVFTDLFEIPNLAGRSSIAVQALGRRLLGLRQTTLDEAALVPYWLFSTLYRCTVLGGAVYYIYQISNIAGVVMALAGLSVLVIRPLARFLKNTVQLADNHKKLNQRLTITGTVILIALLVPFHWHQKLVGIVEYENLRYIFPEISGILQVVEPFGTRGKGKNVLKIHNPEAVWHLEKLLASRKELNLSFRNTLRISPIRQTIISEQLSVLNDRIDSIRNNETSYQVELDENEVWIPLGAEYLKSRWLDHSNNRPLGAVISGDRVKYRVTLDQKDGPEIISSLSIGQLLRIDLPETPEIETVGKISALHAVGKTRTRSASNLPQDIYEIVLTSVADKQTLKPRLRHGQEIQVRIETRRTNLFALIWHEFQQLTLKRIPLS